MKHRACRWPHILVVVGTCLACFFLQALAWEYLKAHKARFVSENGFDVTLGRLQNTPYLTGNTIIMGSSITERLMPTDDVAVIGVPGCSFLAACEFVPYDSFPKGTVCVLEANNIFNGIREDVVADTRKWSFRFFQGSRHFSVVAKPSSLLLSLAYYLTTPGSAMSGDRMTLTDAPLLPLTEEAAPQWTDAQKADHYKEIEGIRQLQARGYRVCLAYVPERDVTRRAGIWSDVLALARAADVPVLDYSLSPATKGLKWTDSIHLDSKAKSTGRLRNTIARDAQLYAR